MQARPITIPRHVVQQRFRPAHPNIPPTPTERSHLLHTGAHYVAEFNPVPPMPLEELAHHADRIIAWAAVRRRLSRLHRGAAEQRDVARDLGVGPVRPRLLLLPSASASSTSALPVR